MEESMKNKKDRVGLRKPGVYIYSVLRVVMVVLELVKQLCARMAMFAEPVRHLFTVSLVCLGKLE